MSRDLGERPRGSQNTEGLARRTLSIGICLHELASSAAMAAPFTSGCPSFVAGVATIEHFASAFHISVSTIASNPDRLLGDDLGRIQNLSLQDHVSIGLFKFLIVKHSSALVGCLCTSE